MSSTKASKSAQKRESLALQSLGERLIGLNAEQLANIPLDERLFEAVRTAQGIKSQGALRRQKQLIGKLMRQVDPEPVRRALDAVGRADRQAQDLFRESERWRDRVANEGSAALRDFFDLIGDQNGELERQSKALSAAADDRSRRIALRRIFSEVRNELASRMQDGPR